jgi:hypothetical protein
MTERLEVPQDDREAKLEIALMEEFLRTQQHTFEDLRFLPEPERRLLYAAAALYASQRLAEIDARAHYVTDLHRHE